MTPLPKKLAEPLVDHIDITAETHAMNNILLSIILNKIGGEVIITKKDFEEIKRLRKYSIMEDIDPEGTFKIILKDLPSPRKA